MITVILFGSSGMLGGYVHRYFKTNAICVIPLTRSELDLSNTTTDALHKILSTIISPRDPTERGEVIVINCAGSIPQRPASTYTMLKVNTIFPRLLADACSVFKLHLIHITTDCVFSGESDKLPSRIGRFLGEFKGYNESDVHDATDVYGISKSLGEPLHCQMIRTSIIGEENRNKVSLLEWVKSKQGTTISGYDRCYWNGVTCLQLAKILYNCVLHKEQRWLGVRHIFSPDTVSKCKLIQIINDEYQLGITINPVDTPAINKKLYTLYDTMSLSSIPPIEKQIREMCSYDVYDD